MRYILSLTLITLVAYSPIISGNSAQHTKFAVVEPNWQKFWKPFQIAARMGKPDYLKQFMSQEFIYSISVKSGKGDQRADAFKYWSTPSLHAWDSLGKSVSFGWAKSPEYSKRFGTPSRVCPAEAADPKYSDWRAVFIQAKDKRWKWKMFIRK